jgi:hypothetical protein
VAKGQSNQIIADHLERLAEWMVGTCDLEIWASPADNIDNGCMQYDERSGGRMLKGFFGDLAGSARVHLAQRFKRWLYKY